MVTTLLRSGYFDEREEENEKHEEHESGCIGKDLVQQASGIKSA